MDIEKLIERLNRYFARYRLDYKPFWRSNCKVFKQRIRRILFFFRNCF